MSLAVAPAAPADASERLKKLDLGPSPSHANVVNIQGLHLLHHHTHAKATIGKTQSAPGSPARNGSPSAEQGAATPEASPTLAPTETNSNDDDSSSVVTEGEIDREMARAVFEGFTTRHVEVNVGGQKVTVSRTWIRRIGVAGTSLIPRSNLSEHC
jgi:hypothetical protein